MTLFAEKLSQDVKIFKFSYEHVFLLNKIRIVIDIEIVIGHHFHTFLFIFQAKVFHQERDKKLRNLSSTSSHF